MAFVLKYESLVPAVVRDGTRWVVVMEARPFCHSRAS